MGSSYIDLQVEDNRPLEPIDPANAATAYLYDGIPVRKGVTGMNSEFFPKETRLKMEGLMDSITQLAKNANDVVGDPETKVSLKTAVANVRDATQQAKETMVSIRKLSDKGTVAVEDIAANVSVSLRELQQVLVRIREGNGTAAQLLNDGRLYENLLDSSQELQSALEQLKFLAADAREKGIKLKW
jgi:hypothetical protein